MVSTKKTTYKQKEKKSTIKKIVKKSKKKISLTVAVLDISGKKKGTVTLPEELFRVNASEKLLAQSIRVNQSNKRQAGALSQTRGEVTGSGRKIWRQKGTGRARHGHRYAPIFVGGGVSHGPRPRDFSMDLNKKMRRKALFGSLSQALTMDKIVVVVGMKKLTGKTKELVGVLSAISCKMKGTSLTEHVLVTTAGKATNVYQAGRNIARLSIREAQLLTAYDIINSKKLIISRDAIDVLKETFVKKTHRKIKQS